MTDWRLPEHRREMFHSSTYLGVHSELQEKFGPASEYLCECGKTAKDWAYQHDSGSEVEENGRTFSRYPEDYAPMCRSCHFRMDNQKSPSRRAAHQKSMEFWRTPEAKEKIRKKLRGKKRPPAVTKKIREAWTPELREKQSEIVKNSWSPERKARFAEAVRIAHQEGKYRRG